MAKIGKKAAKADEISVHVNRDTKTHPGPKAEELDRVYKKSWEFAKRKPPHSPFASEWEHEHATDPEMAQYSFGKVPEFVKGGSHGFGHTGNRQVKGKLRCSGKAGAHQIGKRGGKRS